MNENPETIEIHTDAVIGNAEHDETITVTLRFWEWIALAKLAEYHNSDRNQLVSTWLSRHIARLTTHVDVP